jgi:2-dehydro-3-deoxygluconokinase
MPSLVEHCDIVMGNIWSANSLLGVYVDEAIHDKKSKEAYLEHATASAKASCKNFRNVK